MKNTLIKISALLAIASLSLSVFAADHSVGRATVQQLDDSWQVKSLDDKGIPVSGAIIGTQESETKIFMKLSPTNELLALIVIKGTASGLDMTNARMVYSPKCDSTANFYAKGNTGTNERYFDCLWVNKSSSAEPLLRNWAPQALEYLKTEKITLPQQLRPIQTRYANGNRTTLMITAFMAPSFAGLTGVVDAPLPAGIEPNVVLWGQSLQKATKDSVTSFSGKFAMPPIEFKP
jgi:hypothetical protein